MANSANIINRLPVVMDGVMNFSSFAGVTQVLCSFDTINTDLEVYAPNADANGIPVILGWQHCHSAAHDVKVSAAEITSLSSPQELITYQFSANGGLSKEVSEKPLIIGKKGKSLAIQVSAASVKILLYVAELRVIRL